MSIAVKVENLSKRYLIKHKETASLNTLREIISAKANSLFKKNTDESISSVEEFWALKNINFEIKAGDRIGIIGRNGAGKSTLLKLLSRITEPTSGKISIKGRISSLLEVGTGFHPELSGRENIFLNGSILGMRRAEIQSKFDAIVDFSGVEKFLDTPVKRYSSGMYVRLAFSVAAHLETEILILDEVLAVGDAEFQKKCMKKIKEVTTSDRTIIFVSHSMAAIKQICNNAILLNNGTIVINDNVTEVIESYQQISDFKPAKTDDFNNRDGSGLCRLTAIKLVSATGVEKAIFQIGEKMQFILKIQNISKSNIEGLRFIIGIYNAAGEAFLRFDTKNSMQIFQCDKEYIEITCALDEHLNIRPDFYSVNVAILQDNDLVDYVMGATKFSIDNVDYFGTGKGIENDHLTKVYYKHIWSSN